MVGTVEVTLHWRDVEVVAVPVESVLELVPVVAAAVEPVVLLAVVESIVLVVESEVVIASALEIVGVVFVVAFLEFALFFNSCSDARHSNANETASAIASAISHPPAIKHCSISSSLVKSISERRHFEIVLL